MNELPAGLQNKQEQCRQETVNKVLHGIQTLEVEGQKVKISALMELTGLSRSVFAKAHIRVLLDKEAPVKRKVRAKKKKNSTEDDKNRIISELREKNAALEEECELLRGKLFLLMEKNIEKNLYS